MHLIAGHATTHMRFDASFESAVSSSMSSGCWVLANVVQPQNRSDLTLTVHGFGLTGSQSWA